MIANFNQTECGDCHRPRLIAWREFVLRALACLFITASTLQALSLNLTLNVPQNGMENTSLIAAATVSIGGNTNHPPVLVNLFSGNTNRVQVASSVIIPPGTNSASFDLLLVDNELIDGAENVVIEAWIDGENAFDLDVIHMSDNESRALAMALPTAVNDGQALLPDAGAISFFGRPTTNVMIALQSDRPDLITTPLFITHLAGATNVMFSLTVTSNAATNTVETVRLRASAPGFLDVTGTVLLIDDEQFVPSNPAPGDLSTQAPLRPTLSWTVPSNAPPGITYDVYLGTNSALGAAQRLGSTASNSWILPPLARDTTYYWRSVVHLVDPKTSPSWRFTTRGLDHFDISAVPSPQLVGEPFEVTIVARDELNRLMTEFTNPTALRGIDAGGATTNTILPGPGYESGASDPTVGYSFTPKVDITVTAVRHLSGNKISIWTDSGTSLVTQLVSSIPGVWLETPLPTPIQLSAGQRYRVSSYSTNSQHYCRFYDSTNFPHGTITMSYYGNSDGFPTFPVNYIKWFLVDLRYYASIPVPTTPTTIANFTNGVWSGNVAVARLATNMFLLASNTAGSIGNSNPFDVLPTNQSPVITTQPATQTIITGVTASLTVSLYATPTLHYQWRFNGIDLVNETNAVLTLHGTTFTHSGDYTVVVSNRFGSTTSSVATLTVLAEFYDNFEPGIHLLQWSSLSSNVLATNYGGSVSGVNSLWFGGDGPRYAQSRSLDTIPGGAIFFDLRIASGRVSPWESASLPWEGIVLEYSVDDGAHWVEIARCETNVYTEWTRFAENIPGAAQSSNTRFRWRQLANSGGNYDHWALDDVEFVNGTRGPIVRRQPAARQVIEGASTIFTLGVSGSLPLLYQWQRDGTNLVDATNATLVISSAKTNDVGSYSVVVANSFGSVTSTAVALVVTAGSEPVAVFDNPAYVNTTHPFGIGSSDAVQGSLSALGYPVVTFTNILSTVGNFRTILFPHQQYRPLGPDLTTAERAALSNFVFQGGKLIVQGASAKLLNAILGLSLTETSSVCCFAFRTVLGDESPYRNASYLISPYMATFLVRSGLPAGTLDIYTLDMLIPSTAVAVFPVGSGTIVFMAWDWASAVPNGNQNGGWSDVLHAALQPYLLPSGPPVIRSQPISQSVSVGGRTTFFANATGAPFPQYRWRRNGTNLNDSTRVSGSSSTVLTISSCTNEDAGTYSFVVSNGLGAVQSSNVTLTVSPVDHFEWSFISSPQGTNLDIAVTITARNRANEVVTNFTDNVTLNAFLAGGTAVALTPPVSGNFVSGAWSGNLRVTQMTTNLFLRADGGAGHIGTSSIFNVIGHDALFFSLQPANQNVSPGANVTVAALALSTRPVSYQWRFEGTNIPHATNASYSFVNANLNQHHGNFSVVATDGVSTITSSNALVYVIVPPTVATQPKPQTVLQGESATFNLVANGAPPLTYLWLRNNQLYDTTPTPTLVIPNVQAGANFRAVVRNAAGQTNSITVSLTMIPDFDSDGMGDAWETTYFGAASTNNSSNVFQDADSDGMNNRDEYLAGTNPTNASSVLKILVTATNAHVLQFTAQSNLSYGIQWRTNMLSPAWSNLTSITAQSLVRTLRIHSAIAPPSSEKFFRLVTPAPAPTP